MCQILSDRDRLVRRTRVSRDAEAAEIKVTSLYVAYSLALGEKPQLHMAGQGLNSRPACPWFKIIMIFIFCHVIKRVSSFM